jgi:hypothetical protein
MLYTLNSKADWNDKSLLNSEAKHGGSLVSFPNGLYRYRLSVDKNTVFFLNRPQNAKNNRKGLALDVNLC